jgi:hypothetical protein
MILDQRRELGASRDIIVEGRCLSARARQNSGPASTRREARVASVYRGARVFSSLSLRLEDALHHHGRDAREYGLGHRGCQDVGDRT